MSSPRPPRGVPTARIIDTTHGASMLGAGMLDDRERAYYAPRMGDLALLGILVVGLLATGIYTWHGLGPQNDHAGRAIFFGMALISLLWVAVVYTFKLSACVRVGPHGIAVVRGPWRTELAWRDVTRLVERAQMINGQRYRWVMALARDGRRLQVREDMVIDYELFRRELHERFRLWRDHGGTWSTSNKGPFVAREMLSSQVTWWAVLSGGFLLVGLYFFLLLHPETGLVGLFLLLIAVACAALSVRSVLRRQTYTVDAKAIEARAIIGSLRISWRDISRVERSRRASGRLVRIGIKIGRLILKMAARTDARVRIFEWHPRVPEYLILRGAGHQVRIRLHRLERPDEVLAWVEFYERVGRRLSSSSAHQKRATAAPTRPLSREFEPDDLSTPNGPQDPWAAGQANEAAAPPAASRPAPATRPVSDDDSWLREMPSPDDEDDYDEDDDEAFEDEDETETALPRATRPAQPIYDAIVDADTTHAPTSTPNWDSVPIVDSFPVVESGPSWHEQPAQPAAEQHVWQEPPPERQAPTQPPQATPAAQQPTSRPSWQPPRVSWQAPSLKPTTDTTPDQGVRRPTQDPWAAQPTSAPAPAESRPAHPPELIHQPEPNWDEIMTEETPEEVEQSAKVYEELSETFVPWRDDATWQPPPLPRFGPTDEQQHQSRSNRASKEEDYQQ